jgi:hypothetical protein
VRDSTVWMVRGGSLHSSLFDRGGLRERCRADRGDCDDEAFGVVGSSWTTAVGTAFGAGRAVGVAIGADARPVTLHWASASGCRVTARLCRSYRSVLGTTVKRDTTGTNRKTHNLVSFCGVTNTAARIQVLKSVKVHTKPRVLRTGRQVGAIRFAVASGFSTEVRPHATEIPPLSPRSEAHHERRTSKESPSPVASYSAGSEGVNLLRVFMDGSLTEDKGQRNLPLVCRSPTIRQREFKSCMWQETSSR